MTLYCSLRSRREACAAIVEVAKQRKRILHQRPWNYHKPENTAWWLVPSAEWPAYRYGKLFFDEVEGQSNTLLCGLYVEKGLGAELRDVYTSPSERRCIMQSDWTWFRLLRDFGNGNLEAVITKLSSDTSFPIELWIWASYLTDTDLQFFDPYEPRPNQIIYRFQLQAGSSTLSLIDSKDSKVDVHLSSVLSSVSTIGDLSGVLEELGKNPWLWVDMTIALQFHTHPPPDEAPENVWSSSEIWDKFLCHFLPWLC